MAENEYIKNPQLAGNDVFWEGNQTGVLLIHGFTATTAEVRLMAEKLHQAGFTVAAPLLPGHGTHPDDLNRATWKMWLEKTKHFYEKCARECNRTFIIAESMGALLAIELGAQHPEINGLMLFAPAMKIKGLWVARILGPFKKYLHKSGKDDGLPWKGYTVYPLKAVVEMLKLQQHARKQLSKITQPTLVFTGEFDQSISEDSSDIILNNISASYKKHIHLENSPHCILSAGELDLAYQHVISFIYEVN